MVNPSKIKEGDVEFSLGEMNGNYILYDFSKILVYLEAKGKIMFGPHFKLYEEDRELIYRLCNYFIKDKEKCDRYGIDLNKGLLLSGPVGCGKTSLMRLLKYIVPQQRPYELIPTRNITFAFNLIGYKIIQDYGDSGVYCFDDLGIEPMGKFFGKDCNVIGEIMLSRYEIFQKHKIKTHSTTNLMADELENLYGHRVRSRMRQMFNLIAFEETTRDKRK